MPHPLHALFKRYPRCEQLARRMVACVPLSKRLGRRFWAWYAFFEESQAWSIDELRHFQLERLRTLLAELVRTSAFYRQRLQGLDVHGLASLEAFSTQVPALSRQEFRENFTRLLSTVRSSQRPVRYQTSGTTGTPLQFYHAFEEEAREWAAICHQWKRVGYDPATSRRAEFCDQTTANTLINFYPEQHMLRCSVMHMQPEHLRAYADAIREYRVSFYHGYPSALYCLAKGIRTARLCFPQPRAILLASEMVYDWQIAQMRLAFPEAKLFAHYGCTERTILAGWCEHRREYHVLPQYALVEIDPVTSEVIGTNLYNTTNGFVRYRMTDTAIAATVEACPDCGRAYVPLLTTIQGRLEDYLYSPGQGWVPPVAVDLCLRDVLGAIDEIQLWQKDSHKVDIRYTVRAHNDAAQLERNLEGIVQRLQHLLGMDTTLTLERIDDFPRCSAGKFKWIVNEFKDYRS